MLEVAGYRMVVEPALYHATQPTPHLGDIMVHPSPEGLADRLEGRTHPLTDGLSLDREPALPGRSAVMREPQEVEGIRLALAPAPPVFCRETAELQEPGLVGVQPQAELRHASLQQTQERLGLGPVLESHHEIIGVPDDDHIATGRVTSPMVRP